MVAEGSDKPADIGAGAKSPGAVTGDHESFNGRICFTFFELGEYFVTGVVTQRISRLGPPDCEDGYPFHPVDQDVPREIKILFNGFCGLRETGALGIELLHYAGNLFRTQIGHKVEYALFIRERDHAAEIKIGAGADIPVRDIESLGEDRAQEAHPDPLRKLRGYVDLGTGSIESPLSDGQQVPGRRISGSFSHSAGLGRECQRIAAAHARHIERPGAEKLFADAIDFFAGCLFQHPCGFARPSFK